MEMIFPTEGSVPSYYLVVFGQAQSDGIIYIVTDVVKLFNAEVMVTRSKH